MNFRPTGVAGWSRSMEVGNFSSRYRVAPDAAGRVVELFAVGRQWLHVNGSLIGKMPGDSGFLGFHEVGGASAMIAPQSKWGVENNWPPPHVMNSPWDGKVSSNRTEVNSRINSDNLGVVITQSIAQAGDSLFEIEQSFANVSNRLHSQMEWANWNVVQLLATKGESIIYLPRSLTNGASKTERGFRAYPNPGSPNNIPSHLDLMHSGGEFVYMKDEFKIGLMGRWVAMRPHYEDDRVFALFGSCDPNKIYPDENSAIQVYSAGHASYVEIEMAGPLTKVNSRQTRSDTFFWGVATCAGQILDVNRYGVVSEYLHDCDGVLKGAFGLFVNCKACVVGIDRAGLEHPIASYDVTPYAELNIEQSLKGKPKFSSFRVDLMLADRFILGSLPS